eukprot:8931787-Pyramimonas_sp.AAC.1
MQQLRAMLRVANPALQYTMLRRMHSAPFWRDYRLQIQSTTWNEDTTQETSMLYSTFPTENNSWYLGKAKTARSTHRINWNGAVSRFREHWCAAFKGMGGQ